MLRNTRSNPRIDPEAAARTAGSTGYFASQFLGNVVGLTMLIFGVLALTTYLANTRAKNLAFGAMILNILGIAPVLSALGVNTYAFPVLGQAYLESQRGSLAIVDAIFGNPLRITEPSCSPNCLTASLVETCSTNEGCARVQG
jgi:uncharacterized membrane protein HdeD (DUF308 family)